MWERVCPIARHRGKHYVTAYSMAAAASCSSESRFLILAHGIIFSKLSIGLIQHKPEIAVDTRERKLLEDLIPE
jgi:hypothetical protein